MHKQDTALARARVRFDAKVAKSDGCWLWTGAMLPNGYGSMRFLGKQQSAHRISYQLAYGAIPHGMFVCHRCDVRACIRPDHLFLGTAKENSRDMVSKGRSSTGERRYNAKLTWPAVREIRRLHPELGTQALARRYGVTKKTVYAVVHGQGWRE